MIYLLSEDSYGRYESVAPMLMSKDGEFMGLRNVKNVRYINIDNCCASGEGFDYDMYGIPDEMLKNICIESLNFYRMNHITAEYRFSEQINQVEIDQYLAKRKEVLSDNGKYTCEMKVLKDKSLCVLDTLQKVYESEEGNERRFFAFLKTKEQQVEIQATLDGKGVPVNNSPLPHSQNSKEIPY